jgi:hypothetical protein
MPSSTDNAEEVIIIMVSGQTHIGNTIADHGHRLTEEAVAGAVLYGHVARYAFNCCSF